LERGFKAKGQAIGPFLNFGGAGNTYWAFLLRKTLTFGRGLTLKGSQKNKGVFKIGTNFRVWGLFSLGGPLGCSQKVPCKRGRSPLGRALWGHTERVFKGPFKGQEF